MMNSTWQNMGRKYFLNNFNMEEKKNFDKSQKNKPDAGVGEEKKVTITLNEYEMLRTECLKSRDIIYNLREKLNDFGEALNEKRVSYMLRVLENAIHFDNDFVAYCASEIKKSLYIEEKEEKSE